MTALRGIFISGAAAMVAAALVAGNSRAEDETTNRIDSAEFTENGDLVRPADLDDWVFLGASLGMGYNEGSFDPASPGLFQIVTMEPEAYAYFREHGEYADGSMFALLFYRPVERLANNRNGFVMGDIVNFEIHLKDSANFEAERGFYVFSGGSAGTASLIPSNATCYECHTEDGAFDGTFAQFYPEIRSRIPEDMLDRVLEMGEVRLNH